MVRGPRASDVIPAALYLWRREHREFTAPTWPKAPPENRRPQLSLLLPRPIPSNGKPAVGIVANAGSLGGIVVARPRADGLVWDVEHLVADNAEAAVDLVRWCCDVAHRRGGRRVFFDTPVSAEGESVPRRAAFERFTAGAVYRLDVGSSQEKEGTLPARPRLRSDEAALFQLYNAAVPGSVRAAEAMTQDEWSALYPGRKRWEPQLLGNRQDYVWELGPRVVGWMRIVFGQRSQSLDLLIHPMYESYADQMVRYALSQLSAKVPVLVSVREYQGEAAASLERLGFSIADHFSLWVRQLAARVKEPSLATVHAPVRPTL